MTLWDSIDALFPARPYDTRPTGDAGEQRERPLKAETATPGTDETEGDRICA